ncbi:hypothetical protein GCM10010433_69670 [Streptomyces pulveraceus]
MSFPTSGIRTEPLPSALSPPKPSPGVPAGPEVVEAAVRVPSVKRAERAESVVGRSGRQAAGPPGSADGTRPRTHSRTRFRTRSRAHPGTSRAHAGTSRTHPGSGIHSRT